MFTFPFPEQSPLSHQILQIAGSRSSGRTGNTDEFFRTQAADENLRAFPEQLGQHFFLMWVQLPAQAVIEFGFTDQELNPRCRVTLGG